ncbi:MAG: NAD(P)H-hydrate dehydratase [Hyphomicrobiales bacterium]
MTDVITSHGFELLTPAEMYEADRLTIEGGTPGIELMENAGAACAQAITERYESGKASVLCGPGNNGGDGYVIARHLADAGWEVRVFQIGDAAKLKDDAAAMAKKWRGKVEAANAEAVSGVDLIVDAIFGAGLDRDVTGLIARIIDAANASEAAKMAVDMPSGVDGRSGRVLGTAFEADLTVTFFRKKPGHLLMPGRALCGELVVADIGIGPETLEQIAPGTCENAPALWRADYPTPLLGGHKYARGHAVSVTGAMAQTGAGRLAAEAALRTGAGLVTVAAPADALMVNACHLTTVMLKRADNAAELAQLLDDKRKNAIVLGPGAGVGGGTRAKVRAALASGASVVLDADALTAFSQAPDELFEAIGELPERPVVMTPHAGEFPRLFNEIAQGEDSKCERARKAATASGAVIVIKGPDTVIAALDGRTNINSNAPPTLATAGSGDVLAGLVCGLLAQGMEPFNAASASVWLHGAAADAFGPGLIAEDIISMLPAVLPLAYQTDE